MKKRNLAIAGAIAGSVALGIISCTPYVTTVHPVEDEMIVKLVADPTVNYDHPVRFTAEELTRILQHVQIEYKAGWLQNWLAKPSKPLPLFDPDWLPRVVPALVKGFEKANRHDRIVFYVADRRSDVRREVTGGSLFVVGRLMHIVVSNFRNGVDVVPGVLTYDRANPEIAVSPQRFTVTFDRPEVVVHQHSGLVEGLFGAVSPSVVVDYWLILNNVGPQAGREPSPG
ncbi:MAG TPA: hypothetical protein VGJ57_12630 [Nitrospirales bacterium]|jgi:hypothetical protein